MFWKCTSLEEIHLGATSGFEIIENSLKDWLVDDGGPAILGAPAQKWFWDTLGAQVTTAARRALGELPAAAGCSR